MPRGGSKPGERRGGRKKGSLNKTTKEQRQRAAASGLLPHEFLLAVSRGEIIDGHLPTFAERMDAAEKAAPFYAPRLASIEATGKGGSPIEFAGMTADELRALIFERYGLVVPAGARGPRSPGKPH